MSEHISKRYDAELESVRTGLLQMGGLIEQQIEHAMRGVIERNLPLLEEVIATEKKVNAMEIELDEACNQLIAKRQPAASGAACLAGAAPRQLWASRSATCAYRVSWACMAMDSCMRGRAGKPCPSSTWQPGGISLCASAATPSPASTAARTLPSSPAMHDKRHFRPACTSASMAVSRWAQPS